jgi:hypothetical protein
MPYIKPVSPLKEKLEEKKFYSQSLKEAKKYVSIFEKSLKKTESDIAKLKKK